MSWLKQILSVIDKPKKAVARRSCGGRMLVESLLVRLLSLLMSHWLLMVELFMRMFRVSCF